MADWADEKAREANVHPDYCDCAKCGMVAAALREVAKRCAEILQKESYLSKIDPEDDGGCEGCESGWCQSAVDAVCESRNRVADAIKAEFPVTAQEER